jgi:hypothetical protein
MPQNYYEDGEMPKSPDSATAPEDTESKTALIPKEICPGKKPGDTITMRVVRVHDDQYEVEEESSSDEVASEETPMTAPATDTGGNPNYE